MSKNDTDKMIKAARLRQAKEPKYEGKTYTYFAYGSNMAIGQMLSRCPKSKPMFKATLHCAELVFKHYADVEYRKGSKRKFVRGACYEITADCMKALDRYEGFPRFYKKVKCIVQGQFGKYYEAFMYVMQPGVRQLELPTESYLNTIHQGYQDWKIPVTSLCNAWEQTVIQLDGTLKKELTTID